MRLVYVLERLVAGDVVFDEVAVLQSGEFDREAVVDMADYPPLRLADRDHHIGAGPGPVEVGAAAGG